MTQPRCRATTRAGVPCKRFAIRGGAVCPAHGGSAKHVKRAARTRDAEAKAARLLTSVDAVPVANPLVLLAQVAGEAVRLKDVLGVIVDQLRPEEIRSLSPFGGEELRADLAAYERALDRVGKFAVNMARLNLDERLVAVNEALMAQLVQVIRGIVMDLGHSPTDPAVSAIVTRRLRAVPSSEVGS
ncbi:MAG: hypothetical protein JWM02_3513 [Frankiales bacterium]|nr:hypothetical protein [Frankiales bacterium]